jgi:hypothetical protein
MREMRTRCANARWPKNISRRNSVSVTELTRSERDETHSIQKTVLPYQSPFVERYDVLVPKHDTASNQPNERGGAATFITLSEHSKQTTFG